MINIIHEFILMRGNLYLKIDFKVISSTAPWRIWRYYYSDVLCFCWFYTYAVKILWVGNVSMGFLKSLKSRVKVTVEHQLTCFECQTESLDLLEQQTRKSVCRKCVTNLGKWYSNTLYLFKTCKDWTVLHSIRSYYYTGLLYVLCLIHRHGRGNNCTW